MLERRKRLVFPWLMAMAALLGMPALRAGAGEAAGAGQKNPPAAKPKVEKWSVLPHLPQESVLVISVKDALQSSRRLQQTGLWKLYNNPDVQSAFKAPLLMARGGLVVAEQNLGLKLKDLLEGFQGEVTFSFLGFLDGVGEDGKPIPDLLLSFQTGGKSQAWMEHWERLVDKLNAKLQNTLEINRAAFDGVDVVTLSHPNLPLEIHYAMADGVFLVGMGPGRIENILAARKAAKAGGKGAPKTLAAVPSFQRAQKELGAEGALIFLNLEQLRKIPQAKMVPKNEQQRKEFEALGLPGIKSLAYGVRFQGKGMREALFVDAPEKERTGLLTLLGGSNLTARALSEAPKNSVVALAMQTDPKKMLDRLVDLAGLGDPGAREKTEAFLAKIGQQANLDIRKDVLGALSGRMLFTLAMPDKHPKLRFGLPQPLLTIHLENVTSARKALNALRRSAADTWDFFDLQHGEQAITVAREKFPKENKDPGTLCWTVLKDRVIASLFPLALRDELDRLAAGGTRASESLAEDADFKAAFRHLGGAAQMLAYVDTGAVATALYDLFVPIGQINGKGPKQVNLLALPSASVLARNLSGTLFGISTDAEGVTLKSFSSAGLISTILPVVGAGMQFNRKRGRAAEKLDPALVAQREVLRGVHQRLQAYARDHGGAFPPTLEALIPKYVRAEDANPHLAKMKYFGKQPQANRVVAAYTGGAQIPAGQRVPLLLQDGRVVMLPGGQLDKALREGFVRPKAAGPKPAGAGAVKPPPPPPDF